MNSIIKQARSVIPACDEPLSLYERLVKETAFMEKIGGYKVGFFLMLSQGLPEITALPKAAIYYNHRSGASDIPDMGGKLLQALAPFRHIQGIILTPTAGPATQQAWIRAAQTQGRKVIVEPLLPTKGFLKSDSGYLEDDAIHQMITLALSMNVDGFIFPDSELGETLTKQYQNKAPVYGRKSGTLEAEFCELTSYDVLLPGLAKIVELTRIYTDKPLIYDHQKAATDVPEKGETFAKSCKNAGIDAVILFPQAGPESEKAWTKAAHHHHLPIIVGGLMTHPHYLRSEGGYIDDQAIVPLYLLAAQLGVTDFVVPGNRPDDINTIKAALENKGVNPTFYSPGLVAQGGKITQAAKVAGERWHAIVGRGITQAPDIRKAALEYTSQL